MYVGKTFKNVCGIVLLFFLDIVNERNLSNLVNNQGLGDMIEKGNTLHCQQIGI